MKRLISLLFLIFPMAAAVCAAQAANTFNAKDYPGPDVAAKVTSAQAACNPDRSVPCVIVLDPSLATLPNGVMPAKCAQCTWLDYRHGLPGLQPEAATAGLLSADQLESPPGTGHNGIALALAQCSSHSSACSIVVSPQYSRTEPQPWGSGETLLTNYIHVNGPKSTDPLGCLIDYRWGVPETICNQGMPNGTNGDPANASARFLGSSPLFAQNVTSVGNGYSPHTPPALALQDTIFSGGRDFNGDETYQVVLDTSMSSHTPGTVYDLMAHVRGYSPGDNAPIEADAYGVGSSTSQNEGLEWRTRLQETGNVYQGTLKSVTCGVTCTFAAVLKPPSVPDGIGSGLPLIDITHGYNTGYISSIRQGTFKGAGTNWDSAFGVTTAVTTTTAAVTNLSAGSTRYVNAFPHAEISIQVANASGFRAGQIACMFDHDDPSWQCAHITAVGSGTLTVDRMVRPLSSGSTVAAGGLTGYGFGMDADWIVPGQPNGMPPGEEALTGTVRQVYPIVSNAAGDSLTIFTPAGVNQNINTRAYNQMGGSGGTASITVSAGVVTACTVSGGAGYLNPNYSPPQLVISGITSTTAPVIYVSGVKGGVLSSCSVASGGSGISGAPTVSVVAQNPYHIWPQALTLDVYNHTTGALDGSAIVTTPAVGTFSNGDAVEQAHYFRIKISGLNMATEAYQEGGQHNNFEIQTGGTFGGNDTEMNFRNRNDPTVYQNYPVSPTAYIPGRGQLSTPHGILLFGPHRNGLLMQMPPYGGNGNSLMAGLYIGCGTAAQCAKWNTTVPVLGAANTNLNGLANDVWGYNPVTQSWSATAGATTVDGGKPSCTFTFSPTGFSSSGSGCSGSAAATPAASAGKPSLAGTTASIGGSPLRAGACASGEVNISGASSSMAIVATPVTYPGDGIFWHGYVSAPGTVTVKVCATTAEMPAASTYNVRAIP